MCTSYTFFLFATYYTTLAVYLMIWNVVSNIVLLVHIVCDGI